MVLAGPKGEATWRPLEAFLARANIEWRPSTRSRRAAREAFLRFGKGRHPAALNFGDCAAYALAKARARPCCLRARISPRRTS